ncbi:hypothetical protein B0H66DRAFT_247291 [Apodospora peruviana]|uniref:Uncharacterized protein n=1 Tax=Apodospora peruviana TaxID=516989 RepID=A0AAE0I598_9PEZI|nr:hypothetical protein B0H66DRAFT_247291 [Apodospora peruviana]
MCLSRSLWLVRLNAAGVPAQTTRRRTAARPHSSLADRPLGTEPPHHVPRREKLPYIASSTPTTSSPYLSIPLVIFKHHTESNTQNNVYEPTEHSLSYKRRTYIQLLPHLSLLNTWKLFQASLCRYQTIGPPPGDHVNPNLTGPKTPISTESQAFLGKQ